MQQQTFKNPKPALMSMLGESGKVPGEENGVKKKGNDAAKKRKSEKGVCLLCNTLC